MTPTPLTTDPKLKALARSKLAESTLDWDDARSLKLRILGPRAVAALAPNFSARGGIVFTYFDPDGRPIAGPLRVRYLEDHTGFGRGRRYDTPAGVGGKPSPLYAYLPPLAADDNGASVPWRAIAADPEWTVILTEGELKAAAGTKAGFATIGLSGVDAWQQRKLGRRLIPPLDEFDWTGRKVYIVYDSDIRDKPQVRRAYLSLCRRLIELGAIPHDASLPAVAGEGTGLDDYLRVAGRDALAGHLKKADRAEGVLELWSMNAEVAYVRRGGFLVHLETGEALTERQFSLRFRSRKMIRRTWKIDKQGRESIEAREVSLVTEWLAWPLRTEVEKVVYRPRAPRLTTENEYNLWRGFTIEPRKPKRGELRPFYALVDHLFGRDVDARDHVLRWFAHLVRHPERRMLWGVLIWGRVHGSGKNWLGETIMNLFGEHATQINGAQLYSDFNHWLKATSLAIVDEIEEVDQRERTAKLKHLMTTSTVWVNEKYGPMVETENLVHLYLTSNAPNAVQVQPTDRRFFVHEVTADRWPSEAVRTYQAWLDDGGRELLLYHLQHEIDLDSFDAKTAPATAAKTEMMENTRTELEDFVVLLRDDPELALGAAAAFASCDLATPNEITEWFRSARGGVVRAGNVGVGRTLKQLGFARRELKVDGKKRRLWILRNEKRWRAASNDALAAHYREHHPTLTRPSAKDGRRKF